jgi:hypothetical protein
MPSLHPLTRSDPGSAVGQEPGDGGQEAREVSLGTWEEGRLRHPPSISKKIGGNHSFKSSIPSQHPMRNTSMGSHAYPCLMLPTPSAGTCTGRMCSAGRCLVGDWSVPGRRLVGELTPDPKKSTRLWSQHFVRSRAPWGPACCGRWECGTHLSARGAHCGHQVQLMGPTAHAWAPQPP